MEINLLRTVLTVLCFAAFVGIAIWAFGPGQRKRFDEAANLPFADDEIAQRSAQPRERS